MAPYTSKGFFTPPFDTVTSFYQRLNKRCESMELETVESMACFTCVKAAEMTQTVSH